MPAWCVQTTLAPLLPARIASHVDAAHAVWRHRMRPRERLRVHHRLRDAFPRVYGPRRCMSRPRGFPAAETRCVSFAPAEPTPCMRVFSRLESEHAAHKIAIRPQVEGMIDLEAFGGGSTAPAAQKALRFLSVTQTNARPAVRLIANGDGIGQSGGLFCVHRNLVCTCARGQGSQELQAASFNARH